MIQIYSFITALKVTWLRGTFYNLIAHGVLFQILIWTVNFQKEKIMQKQNVKQPLNPFWKDVLRSWKHFCKSVTPETLEDILYSQLWFNAHIAEGQTLYIKEWHDKGTRNVIDLLYSDDSFISLTSWKKNIIYMVLF